MVSCSFANSASILQQRAATAAFSAVLVLTGQNDAHTSVAALVPRWPSDASISAGLSACARAARLLLPHWVAADFARSSDYRRKAAVSGRYVRTFVIPTRRSHKPASLLIMRLVCSACECLLTEPFAKTRSCYRRHIDRFARTERMETGTMRKGLRVRIIGAGTGGLCLAQGLKRDGVEVEVFDRDHAPTDRPRLATS